MRNHRIPPGWEDHLCTIACSPPPHETSLEGSPRSQRLYELASMLFASRGRGWGNPDLTAPGMRCGDGGHNGW